jgi:uncharacterized protein YqjF (DUF2071 family)
MGCRPSYDESFITLAAPRRREGKGCAPCALGPSSTAVSDFPSEIVERTHHRPWPMPDGPWIMTQSWHDLLFAHWPVSARELRERVPHGLELDLFDNQAWLGVVPFRMTNVAPRGTPALPFVSSLNELNVRTYVTRDGKPGVYFFSLDADSQLAVSIARSVFRLPYYLARITLNSRGDEILYWSRRTSDAAHAELEITYRPIGATFEAVPGTLEYFLTERYCLYTLDDDFKAYRLDVHHPPWPLQPATAEIRVNTMADAAGIRLPTLRPLLHFAKRQDMVAWPLTSITSS